MSGQISFAIAIVSVYVMRKRIGTVFRGKPWRWYAVLTLPLLVVEAVIFMANWGASHGVLFRSGGNMGLYYDQIFSYVGWGILSALSMFGAGVYVFGMDRIYLEQKKAAQYQSQAAVYQMMEQQYSQAERLRHDLKNHVLALRGLWEERAWDKLGDYLKRMEDSAQFGANEEATGNRAVDALLFQKRKMAEDRQIVWECDVQIPKRCRISEFDLCVLFGNILDAEKQESRFAEKENLQGHGIGLLNVGDVVRGYDGVMNTEIQNGVFDISVLLPIGVSAYDMDRVV